jgi:aspartate ammonia-lyase
MPGKVNPVIPEAVAQAALEVMAADACIAHAAALGSLELNPFLPLIAERLLTSIELLTRSADILRRFAVEGLEANREKCRALVETATATLTALVERLGYEAAQELARSAREQNTSLRTVVISRGYLTEAEFVALTSAESVNRLGSR